MAGSQRLPMGDISINIGSAGLFVNGKKMASGPPQDLNFAITHTNIDSQPAAFFTPLDPSRKGQQTLPGFTEVFGPRESLPSPSIANPPPQAAALPLTGPLQQSPDKVQSASSRINAAQGNKLSTLAPKKRKSDTMEAEGEGEVPAVYRDQQPSAAKKSKTGAGSTTQQQRDANVEEQYNVSDISLAREEKDEVPVFDTCDTIRRKIRAFLNRQGVTQAFFLRSAAASFSSGRKFQGAQLHRFLAMKGATQGNTSGLFYGSYVFFEKLRIKENKPKSADRLVMEKEYPGGFNVTEVRNHIWAFAGEKVGMDKYGKVWVKGHGARR